ncbi:hypothetical protein K8S17_00745 [bacterium]|nr:hypothetical protein [bacterium]
MRTAGANRGGLTWLTGMVAVALLAFSVREFEFLDLGAVGIMTAIGLGTGLFAFQTQRRLYVSFSTAVYVATIALFGAHIALWVVAATGIVLEAVVHRSRLGDASRSVSVRLIAVAAAGVAYSLVGGRIPPTGMSAVDVARFVAMFACFGVTSSVVAAAAGVSSMWSFREYGRWFRGRGVVVELAMLPLSMLMVASYTPGEPATFPLLAIVLIVSGAAARSLWDTRRELVNQMTRLGVLADVGRLGAQPMSLTHLVETIADLVRCRTEALCVTLVMNEGSVEGSRARSVLDNETASIGESQSKFEDELLERLTEGREMLAGGKSLLEEDAYGWAEQSGKSVGGSGTPIGTGRDVSRLASWVGVPLLVDGRSLGGLMLWFHHESGADRTEIEFLDTLGAQIARVLESAALREQVEQRSKTVEEWNRVLEQRVEERTERLTTTERQLAALNADLERRVKERTMQLTEVQTRMVRSGRLAAVGELAAGVAHELNNPLGGILGYVQHDIERLARRRDEDMDSEERDEMAEHLRLVEGATQRCRGIVSNLLTFAEASGGGKDMMDINDAVRATLRMMADQLKMRGIEVRLELASDVPWIMGSSVQLQHVFMNIVVNARNAMDSGGILVIRTGSDEEVDGLPTAFASFEDTGEGIASENLDRVWQPFFTTREVGQGTGLGLSVSYGIVREHGGEMEVESEVGMGTTFRVRIPAAPVIVAADRIDTRMESSVDHT